MTEPTPTNDPEPVDTERTAQILLDDPEDYHQTQRLREIHDTRRYVMRVLSEASMRGEDRGSRKRIAYAVAGYTAELEPLFNQTEKNDDLPKGLPWDTVAEFTANLGRRQTQSNVTTTFNRGNDSQPDKQQYGTVEQTMAVFRKANDLLAEVKPLVDGESDEWEV
jgi:hypothetical protein